MHPEVTRVFTVQVSGRHKRFDVLALSKPVRGDPKGMDEIYIAEAWDRKTLVADEQISTAGQCTQPAST